MPGETGNIPAGAQPPSEQIDNEGPAHSPDCTRCVQARPALEKIRHVVLAQRDRFSDQTLHPYVAGKISLHRSSCSTVEDLALPPPSGEGTDPAADQFERELLGFAHAQVLSSYRPNLSVMTAQEAAGWVRARTGPRGGARFRLCKLCAPRLPVDGA
ncbi:hypothetical protein ACPEIF_20165 [Streptomyces sp. NPDC012600]|uniref:hypothetical protein n=1 Tax=Streptomyces sp. NPDC012600 TaxID=3415005 RepID=UPI003C2ED9A9